MECFFQAPFCAIICPGAEVALIHVSVEKNSHFGGGKTPKKQQIKAVTPNYVKHQTMGLDME